MEQEIRNVSPAAPMRSGWQSGLLQPEPPRSHAWSPATCPREAPRWRGALWWLWGTEPGSRTGAPDHFSNSRFRFSFASGCVRVRPIFIPSSDSEPGFRFLLWRCTEGEGLCPPLGTGCLVPHPQVHPHRVTSCCPSFGRLGHSSRCPHRALPPSPASAFTAIPVIPAFPARNRKFLTQVGCSAARKVPLHCSRETWVPVTGHFFPSPAAGSPGLRRVLPEQGCM